MGCAAPAPLTGRRALGAEMPFEPDAWMPIFLDAPAAAAADQKQLLVDLERGGFAARAAVAGRRRNARAAAAIDRMAAAPLISATTLAGGLGMAVKNAKALLDSFARAGIAVEVTHRSKRRLFGLAGLAPLREQVWPPRRPEPGRGRGSPPILRPEAVLPAQVMPDRTPSHLERRAFDYSELDEWMAHADHAIRKTRRVLDQLALRSREPL